MENDTHKVGKPQNFDEKKQKNSKNILSNSQTWRKKGKKCQFQTQNPSEMIEWWGRKWKPSPSLVNTTKPSSLNISWEVIQVKTSLK